MTQEAKVLLSISVLIVVILLGVVFFLSSSSSAPVKDNYNPVDIKLLIKEDSHKIATDSAKITIVEFGDYQCPACALAQPIVKQVLKDYSGKVSFVFRHFPLPQHKNAFIAAQAAEAAGEQEKYWQMHDKLYENQNSWAEDNNPLEIFVKYAQELNLNLDQFKSSVTSNKYQQKITNDKNDGISLGVNSTPTFYYIVRDESSKAHVNGIKMSNFSYSEFKNRIEDADRGY